MKRGLLEAALRVRATQVARTLFTAAEADRIARRELGWTDTLDGRLRGELRAWRELAAREGKPTEVAAAARACLLAASPWVVAAREERTRAEAARDVAMATLADARGAAAAAAHAEEIARTVLDRARRSARATAERRAGDERDDAARARAAASAPR